MKSSRLNIFVLLCSLSLVLITHQNCGKALTSKDVTSLLKGLKSESGGNGSGYDGKIFVHFGQCGTDPNGRESEIYIAQNEAYLTRERCVAVQPPLELDIANISYDPNPKIIYYHSKAYQDQPPTPTPTPTPAPSATPTPTPPREPTPTPTPTPTPPAPTPAPVGSDGGAGILDPAVYSP